MWSVATDFHPYVHFIPKNDKLTFDSDSAIFNGTPFPSVCLADVKKKSISGNASINVKALRFHPCSDFLIECIVGVVEIFLRQLYEKAKVFNEIRILLSLLMRLGAVTTAEVFLNSEYYMHPTATLPASVLSFFPQGFFSLQEEKKS